MKIKYTQKIILHLKYTHMLKNYKSKGVWSSRCVNWGKKLKSEFDMWFPFFCWKLFFFCNYVNKVKIYKAKSIISIKSDSQKVKTEKE